MSETIATPYYWKADIGISASLPRAVNYYQKWLCGFTTSDPNYHQEQLTIMIEYFQQWVSATCFGDDWPINHLREVSKFVTTMEQLMIFHAELEKAGIDPV